MPETARSAQDLLIAWANEQDSWVRAIVSEVLATRRELSPDALDEVTSVYLAEKQLSEDGHQPVPLLGERAEAEAGSESLRLLSLRECRGVNALAEDQVITFNPRMTVLFGENAAGKTGYVRVLKRLANVRSAEPIIPDIHRASSRPGPQATVRFALGSDEHELNWNGETGLQPFTRMSIFDAPAVALHLEDNVTYVYTPADLALFNYVYGGIEGVRTRLDALLAQRQPRHNPFLTAFTRGSTVYPQIEQLGAATDLAQLEALAAVSEAEQSELDALRVSVEALSGTRSEGRSEMLRTRMVALRHLNVVVGAVMAFDSAAYEQAVRLRTLAEQDQAAAAATVFRGGDLAAEARPSWQAFLEAGERYLAATGQSAYPSDDDECIYCQQELDESAAGLLRAYREYASGATTAALEVARVQMRIVQRPLTDSALEAALSGLESVLPQIEEGDQAPAWARDGRQLIAAVAALSSSVASGDLLESLDVPVADDAFVAAVTSSLKETETALKGVEGDARQRAELLGDQRSRIAETEARVTLGRLLPEIRVYVESAAWSNRVKGLLGRFQGLLRGLTEQSKLASEEILNRNFERAFYEECAALRAPNVALGFPGRRGQAARHKSVAREHSLREILSEGEQKVIAVADFLAEASFRTGSAPVVFDDPVTSLDHRRLREMVSRIVGLSNQHQVIVFTHNIWFASELLAEFDRHGSDCNFYQVTDRNGVKGVITGGLHPRVDTPAKVRGRVNAAIQDAEAALDHERADKVEAAYDHIRTWCEAVVETDLLANVTKRYQPNVSIQNLERINAGRLQEAIDVILPIFEKACRYIPGHSQPTETLGVRPTVLELKEDWNRLQQAHRQYTAR